MLLKLLIPLLLSVIIVSCHSKNADYKFGLKLYVSAKGDDSWSGTLREPNADLTDGPFATIMGARDAIRNLRTAETLPEGNVLVEIRGGTYELPAAFELEKTDGGHDSLSVVVYRGQKDAEVRITGGIELLKWELVTDTEVKEKFRNELRNKIYQADLKTSGINDFGSPAGPGIELFFNDQPMCISRYPNKGFVKIAGLLYDDHFYHGGTGGIKGDRKGKFIYDDPRINVWKDEKDAWVHGYWFWDWSEQRHKVAKIDTIKKIIEVLPPYHSYGYRNGQWFYGFNLLSEIDEPGEYYVDREKGLLYFYPPSDIEKVKAYVSNTRTLFSINNVSNISIEGMILEGCRETAVIIKDCNNVVVVGSIIRNTGDWAVTINGGLKNGVTDCEIYNTGSGGIKIEGGDRKTLTPAGSFAVNNDIHHIARLNRVYNPGISLNGVGNRAGHNLIRHVPHMAVYFNGNDHVMEYNEIYDACYESHDAGAVYAGRNWTMRGNIFRYNYMHDISGLDGKGCMGFYLDDMFCGTEVYGNVFNKVTSAVLIGGGRDNIITNNIFIDCLPSLQVDARGLNWYAPYVPPLVREADSAGTLLGIAFKEPPYSTRFPELKDIISDEPAAPKGNVISFNICYGGSWDKPAGFWKASIENQARPYLIMKDNIVSPISEVEDSLSKSFIFADPGFINKVNPEAGNFRLEDDSPALRVGFKQIPFKKIGLYNNKYRTIILPGN